MYEVQREVVEVVRRLSPSITKFKYFSDGCAAQYKNYKNLLNLCNHKADFGIDANWTFFATSHGKSPCDGIGGTVKRLTSRASLRRPYAHHILTVSAMLSFCNENIHGILFTYISEERMEDVRESLKERFASGRTIPGTRSYHFLQPISTSVIQYKRTAKDPSFAGSFNITGENEEEKQVSLQLIRINDYLACRYDEQWWIRLVTDVSEEQQDVEVSFMHPHGPSRNFRWPTRADICWVAVNEILCIIEAPITATGAHTIYLKMNFTGLMKDSLRCK